MKIPDLHELQKRLLRKLRKKDSPNARSETLFVPKPDEYKTFSSATVENGSLFFPSRNVHVAIGRYHVPGTTRAEYIQMMNVDKDFVIGVASHSSIGPTRQQWVIDRFTMSLATYLEQYSGEFDEQRAAKLIAAEAMVFDNSLRLTHNNVH